MDCIIAGSRDYPDRNLFYSVMARHRNDVERVISGGAKGPDAWGIEWANANNKLLTVCPADWDTHGKAAGPIRNRQMAEQAHMLICFWDGRSRGTKNMINEALKAGLEVHVYR